MRTSTAAEAKGKDAAAIWWGPSHELAGDLLTQDELSL